MKKALRGLCLAVALWGCHDTHAGFDHWPEKITDESLLGEFDEVLALTEAVAHNALRSPPLEVLVAAEVEAMVSYVRQSGRGQVELSKLEWKSSYGSAYARLQLRQAALQLIPYLELESAPRELGHVALGALQAQLGNDAVYRQLPEVEEALAANDLLPELRDGVAILSLGRTDAQTIDRAAFMLSQWAGMVPPPRALVLDLRVRRVAFVPSRMTRRGCGCMSYRGWAPSGWTTSRGRAYWFWWRGFLRHGEAVGRRRRDFDAAAVPFGALTVAIQYFAELEHAPPPAAAGLLPTCKVRP